MHYRAVLNNDQRLNQKQAPLITPVAGNAMGIIAVNLNYPKLPGNVVNATTFDFPVEYEVIDVEIEDLFTGNSKIKDTVIKAAQKLEKRGVRAIVGACGYFANFQDEVKNAVNVPVFLSSLAQLPIIKFGLKTDQKVGVFVASYENATEEFLNKSHASKEYCVIQDVGSLSKFHPIRYGEPVLDNAGLTQQLINVSTNLIADHPEIGAILLECSDLPPYASAIQSAVGLPVFDFITLINWVFSAVVQTPYYGYY
ncbi:aspartate/glutamate racemase family protein [Lactobacillus sp. LC28-10]|uniref:Aspartate/glutamate racemase family protein n=1 Tax=Secundilactobacillus angelensis TaxID=2722706 RepID=A0ABX1KYU7_9LACO|nr:aspartate/glutamate racemase family protein [Secundilactobacillus angelensis]MCH5462619.1 aspartate/glutamate racemase family protein [Secundilactobacillus angelensis]NLR19111.1 aspartate/glutamate racemase family protein [Secundilactobacillus angelensis]